MNVIIRNKTKGTLLADVAGLADTSKKRRVGLLNHTSLPDGQGLLIGPCEAVHTFGMKFAIDVVFLDNKYRILKIRENMGRGKLAFCLFRASSVLELPAGKVAQTGTQPGDELEIQRI